MSLSSFLLDRGFYIKNWLKMDDRFFVEILSAKKAVPILLRIPNEFSQDAPSDFLTLHKEVVSKNSADTIEDYTKISEPFIEQTYNSITHHIDIPQQHQKPMSYHLQTPYRHPVIVEQTQELEFTKKLMVRQMGRLKYCVQGLPHTLACINGNICCYLPFKETRIQLFTHSSPLITKKGSRLYVCVELAIMYDRIDTVENEVEQVLDGIYKILVHTQTSHVENIRKLIARLPSIETTSDKILDIKRNYMDTIGKFSDLLEKWTDKQSRAEMELGLVNDKYPDSVRHNMKREHLVKKLTKRIEQCKKARREIVEGIENVRTDHEHLSLDFDYILFDNIVMVDKTIQNFEYLAKLEKSLH